MSLKETQIGVAFTGSFCTYKKAFLELQNFQNCCGSVQTVFSTAAASTDSRFGSAESFYRRAEEITGNKPMMTISEAEPIRSEKPFRRTCDPSVHRKYACQTGKRNHRHTCFNGGKSPFTQQQTASFIFIDKRRPRYEYEKYRTSFKYEKYLLCSVRAG